MLGNQGGCSFPLSNSGRTYNQGVSPVVPTALYEQKIVSNGSSPLKVDDLLLKSVSYLRRDHHLGCIQIHPNNQCGGAESKKMAVIFYASRDLKDCSRVHLSNQGVTVTYLDGKTEHLNRFIEVEDAWLDRLAQDNAVELLFCKDLCSKLEATHAKDFYIFNASNYSITSLNDAEHLSNEGGIKLLQDNKSKARYQNIDYAGFMGTKSTPVCTSELIQLVRHLSTDTLHATNIISSALVCGNSLQPAASLLEDVIYCYIRHGNRYRLILLNNGASSFRGNKGNGPVTKRIVGSSPVQVSQEEVVVTGDLKKPKQTAEMAIQTDDILPGGNDNNGDECMNAVPYEWDDSFDYLEYSDCATSHDISPKRLGDFEDEDSGIASDNENSSASDFDMSDGSNGKLDDSEDEDGVFLDDCDLFDDDQKKDNHDEGDSQGDNYDANPDLMNLIDPLKQPKNYYIISCLKTES